MRHSIYLRISMIIFFAISLVGCATTGREHNIQTPQLQNRVNYLEAELQKKNQQISNLESELEGLKEAHLSLSKEKREGENKNRRLRLSIKEIQAALKNAKFYNGPIDGKMGPQTKEAIKTFQKANGLTPDGVVGKRTRLKLHRYL